MKESFSKIADPYPEEDVLSDDFYTAFRTPEIYLICVLVIIIFFFRKTIINNLLRIYIICALAILFIPFGIFVLYPIIIEFNEVKGNINYLKPPLFSYGWNGDYDRLRLIEEKFTIKEINYKDAVDFELYESTSSRGFYEYYVYLNTIDTGTVYLKAVKIGRIIDIPLFGFNTDIGNKTEMEIHNQSNGFVKCGPMLFTIHQDFGVDSYLAMFELWYKPKNKGEKRKLATKIYKVSGIY